MCYDFSTKACGRHLQVFEDNTSFSLKKDFEVNFFKILKKFLFIFHSL